MRVNWTIVGGLSVLLAAAGAGSAVAASITAEGASNAARGVNVNTGYTVADVTYTTTVNTPSSSPAIVTAVSFTLTRASGTAAITSGNTVVYAQLMGTAYGNWASCTIGTSSGAVSCTLTGAQQKTIDLVTGTNVVAYDALGIT